MPRLFIGPKEISFINDLTKEYLKDAVGQKIFYYPVSVLKTKVHELYDEAVLKIFDNPIEVPAHIGQPEWETKHTQFGMEQTAKVELWLQARDLLDKRLVLSEGDFFTYGDKTFEITSYIQLNNIFGQEEYEVSYKIMGRLARAGEFDPKSFFKPTGDKAGPFEKTNVQQQFVQQRGLKENQEGKTGDIRQMRERLRDDMADIALGEGPRVVDLTDETPEKPLSENVSSFNNESTPGFYNE